MANKNFSFEGVVQETADIETFSIVLYGEGKIGKTETVARLPATAIMPLESGGIDHVTGFKMNVFKPRGKKRFTDMEEFVAGCAHIAQAKQINGTAIRCVVVDGATFFTGDQVRILAHERGWKDPRAAYRVITDHMRTAISILLNSGLSVIATGHHRATTGAEGKAIAEATGQKYNKEKSTVSLDLNPALMVPFIGGFSHIGYCYRKEGRTMVLFRAADTRDAQIVAGSRGDIFPQTMVLSTDNLLKVMRQAKTTTKKDPVPNLNSVAEIDQNGPIDGDPPEEFDAFPGAKAKPTAAFIAYQNAVKDVFGNSASDASHWMLRTTTAKTTPDNVRESSKKMTDDELASVTKTLTGTPSKYAIEYIEFVGGTKHGKDWDAEAVKLIEKASNGHAGKLEELAQAELQVVMADLATK